MKFIYDILARNRGTRVTEGDDANVYDENVTSLMNLGPVSLDLISIFIQLVRALLARSNSIQLQVV